MHHQRNHSAADTEALLAKTVDPSEAVTCYCAARTTPPALPGLSCIFRSPEACLARHNRTRPANNTRFGGGFYRCTSRAPLRPNDVSVWPAACEPTYQVVPASMCVHTVFRV